MVLFIKACECEMNTVIFHFFISNEGVRKSYWHNFIRKASLEGAGGRNISTPLYKRLSDVSRFSGNESRLHE